MSGVSQPSMCLLNSPFHWSFTLTTHFLNLHFQSLLHFTILPPTVGSVHFSGPAFILPENTQVVNPVILAELQLGAIVSRINQF